MIKELRRLHPQSNIVAIDFDPGASEVNQLNRIKLMLSTAFKNMEKKISQCKQYYRARKRQRCRKSFYRPHLCRFIKNHLFLLYTTCSVLIKLPSRRQSVPALPLTFPLPTVPILLSIHIHTTRLYCAVPLSLLRSYHESDPLP